MPGEYDVVLLARDGLTHVDPEGVTNVFGFEVGGAGVDGLSSAGQERSATARKVGQAHAGAGLWQR